MAIPNYIVNLEGLSDAIIGAYSKDNLYNLGSQRIYGMELNVTNSNVQTLEWEVPMDIHIVGIKYGVNDCRNIGYEDSFNMYIDDEKIFEDIYVKEMYEYKSFRQHRPVARGSKVTFDFFNREKTKKQMWFDIHYANKNIEAKIITIICIDKNTKKEIQKSEMLVQLPFIQTVFAPVLDKYNVVGQTSYGVNMPVHVTKDITLVFEYTPATIEATVICIRNTDGLELSKNTLLLKVPIDKNVYAPNISGYSVVGNGSEHIVMDTSNSMNIEIIFRYEITPINVSITYLDVINNSIIKKENVTMIPPINQTFNALLFNGYKLVSEESQTIQMGIDNSKDVDITFKYESIKRKITIICMDIEEGVEIDRTYTYKYPPINEFINAPNMSGYTIFGEEKQHVLMSVTDSKDIELIFNYKAIKIPDAEIPHDYDWKIVMKWEGNCQTDLDLYGVFSNGEEVSYFNPEVGENENKAWLDYDYTSHSNSNDREDKPEIITILGNISDSIIIGIDPYSRANQLTEDVTLQIQRFIDGSIKTVKSYTIPCDKFKYESNVSVCRINLITGQITNL